MIFDLINKARQAGASDLHLTVGAPPVMRIDGDLQAMDLPALTSQELDSIVALLLKERVRLSFDKWGDADFAFCDLSGGRCRANIFRRQGEAALAVRLISSHIASCAELGLPAAVSSLTAKKAGLVLVTGATGSGKSTTLAALIDKINRECRSHIITLEDPIEYVHQHNKCIINQREVGSDTASFASGLRAALREDPDVIMVGELRDSDTIATALTAAETGHLVLATLHTQSAAATISRILDSAADNDNKIRTQLAECLLGVVCQELLPKNGGGRIAAYEVLIATPALRSLIREGKVHQLLSYIQTGAQHGMILKENYIARLRQQELLAKESL